MKVVTTNQELIEGRRYLCRSKQPFTNGIFPKPTVEKVTSRSEGNRKIRLLGGEWSFDKTDRILSFDGEERIAKEALAINLAENPTKPIKYYLDYIRENPFETSYFGIDVIDTDYIENSQALKKWDVIGPIPEIKEEMLHAMFEYPSLIACFSKSISLHPDGDIAVIVDDEGRYKVISDQEDLKEVITILEDQIKPIFLNPEHMAAPPKVWNEGRETGHLCGVCMKELTISKPSNGGRGTYVHKDTGRFECGVAKVEPSDELKAYVEDKVNRANQILATMDQASTNAFASSLDVPDENGFVTTESCGDKVGKQIRLTEKKHNQFGYYNEGAVLTISCHNLDSGYRAGILMHGAYGQQSHLSIRSFQNEVNVGYDGFEFVD